MARKSLLSLEWFFDKAEGSLVGARCSAPYLDPGYPRTARRGRRARLGGKTKGIEAATEQRVNQLLLLPGCTAGDLFLLALRNTAERASQGVSSLAMIERAACASSR
jgi:hypothetical protein